MNEGFPKPTSEERERARRAHAEADPTTFSELPVRDGNEAPDVLEQEGQAFYQLKENPQLQQLASRLLKGIINVADVIEGPGEKLYSKEMPLDSIRGDLTRDDIVADLELMNLILGDSDHYIESDSVEGEIVEVIPNSTADGRTATYHDFDQGKFKSGVKRDFSHCLSQASLERLAGKLRELDERYCGPDGKTLASAIYESAVEGGNRSPDLPEDFESFYAVLTDRIRNAQGQVVAKLAGREFDAKGK